MTSAEPTACALTGSTGYVGSILADALRPRLPLVELVRNPKSPGQLPWSLESTQDIAPLLRSRNIATLVHAAWDMRAKTLREMEQICVAGSARLFRAAREAGVRRIVFISTISAFEGCRSAYGRTKLSVEKMLSGGGDVVLRPGLVFGAGDGGVYGGMRHQVRKSKLLPLIGNGNEPQYLLHEQTLKQAVLRAVNGDFDYLRGQPITLAHPQPWPFRDLLRNIAASEQRQVTLLPVPWRLLYGVVRTGEIAGANLPFKSDSILSFVHQNAHPDFSLQQSLKIDPVPYLRPPNDQGAARD